ncbi:hypothetical protein FACS1894208_01400 [Clostridia bacterium]|nr:hypothetical protein FACS1894208_01400 [Clostridia bacterium]
MTDNQLVAIDVRIVTAEIISIKNQTMQFLLNAYIEMGRRLKILKDTLPHGEFGDYIEREIGFSRSTTSNMIRIFDGYAADQITLDGGVAKSEVFGKLTYSQAVALLAAPPEEREELAKEIQAEEISVRELKKLIAQKDKAVSQLESQRNKAETAAEVEKNISKNLKSEISELKEKLKEARQKSDDNGARERVAELERDLAEAIAAQTTVEVVPPAPEVKTVIMTDKAVEFRAVFNNFQDALKRVEDCLVEVQREDLELWEKFDGAVRSALGGWIEEENVEYETDTIQH